MPEIDDALTTDSVLAMSCLAGRPIEEASREPQEVRDDIATRLLQLTLREIFGFRLMQTDPNAANFFYDPASGHIGCSTSGRRGSTGRRRGALPPPPARRSRRRPRGGP